jgi:hypothetical protein
MRGICRSVRSHGRRELVKQRRLEPTSRPKAQEVLQQLAAMSPVGAP